MVVYSYCEGALLEKIRKLGVQVRGLRRFEYQGYHDQSKPSRLRSYLRSIFELFRDNIPEVAALSRINKENKVELVILNNDLQYHLSGVLAAKLADLPCVCRKAGVGNGKKFKRLFNPWVDLFIAISDATARDYLENGFPPEKLITIYEGLDLKEYISFKNNEVVRREFGIPPSAVVVASIGRISLNKGQFDLLEAASMVVKSQPEVMFLLVGEDKESKGLLLSKLEEKAVALGLDQNVRFAGWREDIPDILSAIDIFVQNSSQPEGMSVSNLQAMATGKPRVVTNLPGLRETVIDGVTGLIIPPRDIRALSEAIIRLSNDRNLASRMGRKARLLAEEKYDIEKNVKRLEQVFLQLIPTEDMNF